MLTVRARQRQSPFLGTPGTIGAYGHPPVPPPGHEPEVPWLRPLHRHEPERL